MHATTPRNEIGFTDLIGRHGVSKASPRINAIGVLDEASAAIGLARSMVTLESQKELLLEAMKNLSQVMGILAGAGGPAQLPGSPSLMDPALSGLEAKLAELKAVVKLPKEFNFSGRSQASAALNLARAVVRRAEREVISLYQLEGPTDSAVVQYLNRLSTLCYLLEIQNDASLEAGIG